MDQSILNCVKEFPYAAVLIKEYRENITSINIKPCGSPEAHIINGHEDSIPYILRKNVKIEFYEDYTTITWGEFENEWLKPESYETKEQILGKIHPLYREHLNKTIEKSKRNLKEEVLYLDSDCLKRILHWNWKKDVCIANYNWHGFFFFKPDFPIIKTHIKTVKNVPIVITTGE